MEFVRTIILTSTEKNRKLILRASVPSANFMRRNVDESASIAKFSK